MSPYNVSAFCLKLMRHYDVRKSPSPATEQMLVCAVSDNARGIYTHMFVVLSEEYFSWSYPTHLFSDIVIH